jgi:topoisomerase IV subunit B
MRSELFLVEGDSAGGSAKQARDKEFQAIMPLRGKILNTWEVDGSEVLASQEVHDIAVAIGLDPGSSDLSQLRYGKICILADADSDGLHIATLLCALFVRISARWWMPGMSMWPCRRCTASTWARIFYALDEAERDGILDRLVAEKRRGKPQVTRFKGLGEMNPPQLRETTMDPNTRRLVQLTLEDYPGTQEMMDMLLAKKRAGDRKSWLESKGNLAEAASCRCFQRPQVRFGHRLAELLAAGQRRAYRDPARFPPDHSAHRVPLRPLRRAPGACFR